MGALGHPFVAYSRYVVSCQPTAPYSPSFGCKLRSHLTGILMMQVQLVLEIPHGQLLLQYQQGDAQYTWCQQYKDHPCDYKDHPFGYLGSGWVLCCISRHSVAALAQWILNITCLSKHSFAALTRCVYNITYLSTQSSAALAQCVLNITCLCTHSVEALAHMPCTHTDDASWCVAENSSRRVSCPVDRKEQRLALGLLECSFNIWL
jgi:hypothetical protein